MGVFMVLMWKHWVVRKRRYIQTFIEMATPISLVLGVFLLKDSMRRKVGGATMLTDFPITNFSLEATEPPSGILYTPDSDAAYELMVEVTATLNSFKRNSSYHIRSLSFPNATLAVDALLLLTGRTTNVYAMVEFQDMEGTDLPAVLKYTIRMTALIGSSSTVKYQRLFEKFENVPQSFLPLQWAIDKSFIKLKSRNNTKTTIVKDVVFTPFSNEPLKEKISKTYISTVFFLLTYISFGAPMLPFVFLMNRLLEERATGIQELVKMVGVTPTMLAVTQLLNALPAGLIYCIGGIILLKATDKPLIPLSNPVLIFTGQFLHFMTMIAMAFACSSFSRDAQYTMSMSVVLYVGMWIPIKLMGPGSTSDFMLFFLGLCPHCPAYWLLNEALVSEIRYETGLQYDTLTDRFSTYPDGAKNGCVLFAYIMQLLQITNYAIITWYLAKVRPGKHGIAMPWNFLFTKEYWSKQVLIPQDQPMQQTAPYDPAYKKYFENLPKHMEAGIRIQNVSKIFGKGSKQEFQALNNVTLNIYKGEITVLLGHNGAGKTTLISIITGMIKQTSGKIYVNDKDTVTQQGEVRKHLGFCPQHNLFFPDLTVKEHLVFFSTIKGGTFKKARKSAKVLMNQLDLAAYSNKKTTQLSGGLLRRLQLGCALCGDARVLILDEPTSGLDVEARRELWDTLLSLRGDRTLVLTTHFMEEADVLGDRMAALHLGKLRCHATPMFLKKAVGSGFRINVITKHEQLEDKITPVLRKLVPGVILSESSVKSLVYVLPPGMSALPVFKTLEGRKEEFDIESLGVGVTSLEEVFLELCCDVDTSESDSVTDRDPEKFKYVTGCRLLFRQMKELFIRQIDHSRSDFVAFILLHMVMPFVLCTSLTQIFNILDNEKNLDLSLDLNMYSETGFKDTLLNLRSGGSNKIMSHIRYAYPNYDFTNVMDFPFVHSVDMAAKSGGTEARFNLSKYMTGVSIDNMSATVMYSRKLKHSAPVGLNLLSNILAIQNIQNADGKNIITKLTNNWPVSMKEYHIPKTKINRSLFSIFNICTLIATTVNDLDLPCKERLTVSRHTHIMAGCSPLLYWLVTFIYHMFFYMSFCCSATMIAAAFFDNDHTIDDKDSLWAIFIVVTLSGVNIYVYMYFISFLFDERTGSLILVAVAISFGFLLPILILAVEDLKTTSEETLLSKVTNFIGLFIPIYMFTKCLIEVTEIASFNSFCVYNFDKCPNLQYFVEGFNRTRCCNEGNYEKGPFEYFAFDNYAAGKSIVIIIIQVVFFATLVLFLQYGIFNRWWNQLGTFSRKTYPEKKYKEPNVIQEKSYVQDTIPNGTSF